MSRGGKKDSHMKFPLPLLPSLIGVAFFYVGPIIYILVGSFQDPISNGFVGLNNYSNVIQNEAFNKATSNTFLFMLVCIPMLLICSLLLAIILKQTSPFNRIVKLLILLPVCIPVFTAALAISIFFDANGLVNRLLELLGAGSVNWLNSPMTFWVLIFTYIWRNLGYCVVLWLAALGSIPLSMYEASAVDGASSYQTFKYITIPMIKPTIIIVLLLSIINAFKVYREAYLVSGNYPHESIYLIPHLFNNWLTKLSISHLEAAGVLLVVVLGFLVGLLFTFWHKKEAVEK